jgi:hypothetical protein
MTLDSNIAVLLLAPLTALHAAELPAASEDSEDLYAERIP